MLRLVLLDSVFGMPPPDYRDDLAALRLLRCQVDSWLIARTFVIGLLAWQHPYAA